MTTWRPPPFTLRQLQYVVAVADTLSFSRAAAACHVAQPSLSAQVAQVEGALGVRLFERDRRRVLPTAAGRALVGRARRLLVEAGDLAGAMAQARDPLAGPLRLGLIPTVAPYLLPAATPLLRRAFPRLTALWREDRTAALVDQLEAGALDAILVALEAELPALEHAEVAVDPFVLATRRGDPLGHGAAVGRSELRGAEVLVLDDGHCFRDQVLSFCARGRVREGEFRATSLATLAQLVAGGVGVTLLPALAVPTEAARAHLKIRRFAAPAPFRTIALAWRPRSSLGPALRQVAEVLARAWPRG
jgi:LysR family transcriptional regulator, hydrogen peroxide-inducible genes activator